MRLVCVRRAGWLNSVGFKEIAPYEDITIADAVFMELKLV